MMRSISHPRRARDPTLLGRPPRRRAGARGDVLIVAAMGEALDEDERALFKRLTGRDREPGNQASKSS